MNIYLVYCQKINNKNIDMSTTHVAAVFSKKELAQKYADYWNEKQIDKYIHWIIETPLDYYADIAEKY